MKMKFFFILIVGCVDVFAMDENPKSRLTDRQVEQAYGQLSDERMQEWLLQVDSESAFVVHDALVRAATKRFTSKKFLKNFGGTVSIQKLESSTQCVALLSSIRHILADHVHARAARYCFSHDGRQLAFLRANRFIDIWDVQHGWKQTTIGEQTPEDFCFSPDDKQLFVRKCEGKSHLWQLSNESVTETTLPIEIARSSDIKDYSLVQSLMVLKALRYGSCSWWCCS